MIILKQPLWQCCIFSSVWSLPHIEKVTCVEVAISWRDYEGLCKFWILQRFFGRLTSPKDISTNVKTKAAVLLSNVWLRIWQCHEIIRFNLVANYAIHMIKSVNILCIFQEICMVLTKPKGMGSVILTSIVWKCIDYYMSNSFSFLLGFQVWITLELIISIIISIIDLEWDVEHFSWKASVLMICFLGSWHFWYRWSGGCDLLIYSFGCWNV